MEVAPCSYQPGCAALGSVFPLLSSAVFCGGGAFSGLLAGHSAAGRGLAPFCFPQPGRLRYCTRDSALYLLEASLSCQTCQMLLILTATWWRPELPTQCCLLPSSWGFGGDPSSCPCSCSIHTGPGTRKTWDSPLPLTLYAGTQSVRRGQDCQQNLFLCL